MLGVSLESHPSSAPDASLIGIQKVSPVTCCCCYAMLLSLWLIPNSIWSVWMLSYGFRHSLIISSRSPMAEAVLKHQITQRQSLKGKLAITVDSAGTGAYHEGDDADER